MTNTKFRKRALLSSVAMLLVALVALGSATFAWYEANPTATATGMTMKTTAASGLEITSDTQSGKAAAAKVAAASLAELANWGTEASLGAVSTDLQPASLNQTDGKFYTTVGTNATNGTMKTGATPTADGQYLEERVYFKIGSGSTTSGKVKLTQVSFGTLKTDMQNAVRIALYKNDGTFIGEYANIAADNNAAAYLDASGIASDTKTVKKAGAYDVEVASVTQNAAINNGIIVRVYLDGFDNNVTSSKAIAINAGTDNIMQNLSLSFTLVPDNA